MNDDQFDAELAQFLAPPTRSSDRLFAARVDQGIDDLARLHRAERLYAKGLARDIAALAAALLAGLLLALGGGGSADGVTALLALLPALSLLLVLVGVRTPARHPRPDI